MCLAIVSFPLPLKKTKDFNSEKMKTNRKILSNHTPDHQPGTPALISGPRHANAALSCHPLAISAITEIPAEVIEKLTVGELWTKLTQPDDAGNNRTVSDSTKVFMLDYFSKALNSPFRLLHWESEPDVISIVFVPATEFLSNSFWGRPSAENHGQNPMPLQIIDKNGETTWVNQPFRSLFGFEPKPGISLFSDSQLLAQGLTPFFEQVRQGQTVIVPGFSYDPHLVDPSHPHQTLWLRMTIIPLTIDEGNADRWMIVYEDTTAGHLTMEALLKNEERIRTTLKSIGDAVISTDNAGRVVTMNPVAEQLTGWPLDEAFQKPLTEIFQIIHAVTRQPVSNPIEKVLSTGLVVGLANHTILLSRSGMEYQIADSAAPIRNARMETDGVVLVFRDVTEEYKAHAALAESNERYRRVFTYAPIGIIHYDTNGVIYDANNEFIRIIGSSRKALIGLNMLKHLNDPNVIWGVKESLNGQTAHYDDVYKSVTAEKSTPIRGNFVGIPGEHDQIIGGIGLFEDVSEKRKIEEELRLKNSAFDASLSANSIANADGNLISVNKAFCETWGYTDKKEVIGKPIAHFFTDHNAAAAVIVAIRLKGSWHGEYEAARGDGSRFQAQSYATALYDHNGKIVAYQSSTIDISEKRSVMLALVESESRFRSITENSYDLICLIDSDAKYLYCNQAYKRILGYDPSELIGRSGLELIHPSEREEMTTFFYQVVNNPLVTKSTITARLIAKDGTVKWIEHRSISLSDKGQILITASDHTEKVHAEKNLHQSKQSYADIFNSVSEAIYIQDEAGNFIDINKNAELMYGLSREQLIGQSPLTVAAPGLNDLEKTQRLSLEVFQTGKPARFEFWAIRSNGEIFPKEVIVNKGKYFGKEVLIATAREISQQKNEEKKLKESNARNKAFLDAMPDMMFVFNREFSIVDYHAESGKRLLLPPDAFLNQKIEAVLPPVLVDLTKRMVSRVFESFDTQLAHYELELDGKPHYFESRYVLCGTDEVLAIVREITEQKNNEVLIRESEERYRALADNAFQGILILTLQGDILSANPAMIKILQGESAAGLIGRNAVEFILPESIEKVTTDFANVAAGIDSYVSEYHCKTMKDNTIWIESIGKVIEYRGTQANVVSIRDITEMKEAAEAIRKRDQLLQAVAKVGQLLLSETNHQAAMQQVTDFIGQASGQDRAYFFMVDQTTEEGHLVASQAFEWTGPGIRSEKDNPLLQKINISTFAPKACEALSRGEFISGNTASFDENERALFQSQSVISALLVPVMGDGRLIGFLGFDNCRTPYTWTSNETDAFITVGSLIASYLQRLKHEEALRVSESKYRLLAENSDDVIWMMDLDSKYHYVSPSVLKLRGYTPEENMTQTFAESLAPSSAVLANQLFSESRSKILAGEMVAPQTFRMEQTCKNGTTVWTEINISGVWDQQNKFNYLLGVTRDISLQIEKEKALEKSEQEKAALLRAIPDLLFVFDNDGNYLEIYTDDDNKLIKNRNQLLGHNIREFFPGEITLQATEAFKKALITRQMQEFSYSITRGDYAGHYEARVMPIDNTLLMVVRDTTSFRNAIDSLRQSEQKYKSLQELFRNVADNMPDMLWAKDLEKRFIFVNNSICKNLLNASDIQEPIGKSDMFFATRERDAHPDNQSYHTFGELCIDSDSVVLSTGVTGRFEESGNVKGKFLCLDVVKTPLHDEAGRITGTVGAARDITAKVRDENIRKIQYNIARAVAESSQLTVFMEVVQQQLNTLIDASNLFLALYDVNTGLCHSPFFTDSKDDITEWPADRSATGIILKTGEPLLLHKGDFDRLIGEGTIDLIGQLTECWLGVPMVSDHKTIGALVVQSYNNPQAFTESDKEILNFISQNVSMAVQKFRQVEMLNEALVKAQESDKLKSAFMANMSHEIRTPLNGILGFSNLLADELTDMEEVRYYAGIISKSGSRLLDLINNIIDISRIEAGITVIEYEQVAPADAINDIINQFSVQARNRNLWLFAHVPDEHTADTIVTDPLRLHQIISNLTGNALKFTVNGGVEIGFRPNGAMVEFFVKDTGIGIPDDKLDKIFERFYQVDDSYSRGHEGAGLGLSLCKSLAEVLGGSLQVESKSGEGSTFILTLPNQKGAVTVTPEPLKTDFGRPTTNLADKTILLVEDDAANLDYMKAVLSKNGLSYLTALTGAEAIETCKLFHHQISLVFMDIKLPELDGLSATKIIKEAYPALPVIALTAFALPGDREKAIKAGCDDYLTKPVSKTSLLQVLSDYLT